VALLALTHLSSRYAGAAIEKEARAVFGRTVVPRDFDAVVVPYREKDEHPHLLRWKDVQARLQRERQTGEAQSAARAT
jgi:ribonuclease Z